MVSCGILDICSYILAVYAVESFILLTQIWPSYFKVFNPFIQQETLLYTMTKKNKESDRIKGK